MTCKISHVNDRMKGEVKNTCKTVFILFVVLWNFLKAVNKAVKAHGPR